MPSTRKKVIKTVYKDEDDSDAVAGDFSDSGSEAIISEHSSSEEEEDCHNASESDEEIKNNKKRTKSCSKKMFRKPNKPKFTKSLLNAIQKQTENNTDIDIGDIPAFTVKDLTDADKLLPSVLNLSESDSSDEDEPKKHLQKNIPKTIFTKRNEDSDDDKNANIEYKDVWSNNEKQESEDIAKKTFLELEQHKNKIEEAKVSIENYSMKQDKNESNVKDLLALGEEVLPEKAAKSKKKSKKMLDDSESEMEDWEEVKENKSTIPQQGLQLIVDIPDLVCRKSKKVDVEMMMKRKINRVKKEQQVFMHKVHVLCWLGHGNYVSKVLNDQSMLASALSMVPSKECYPGERVDMKYVEQITSWYHDKVTLKQDKHENKFRPKAPALINILLEQIKKRVFTTKKYIVYVFVSMLRSLGLQCRVIFNFVTMPIRPPNSELCSLSLKNKDAPETKEKGKGPQNKAVKSKKTVKKNMSQLDGTYDSSDSNIEMEDIMQLDGNDDLLSSRTRRTKNSTKHAIEDKSENKDVSPPKRSRRTNIKNTNNFDSNAIDTHQSTEQRASARLKEKKPEAHTSASSNTLKPRKSLSLNRQKQDCEHTEQSVCNKRLRQTTKNTNKTPISIENNNSVEPPKIVVTNEKNESVSSKYFENNDTTVKEQLSQKRKRNKTSDPPTTKNEINKIKTRTKSAPGSAIKSKYFSETDLPREQAKTVISRNKKSQELLEDSKRVSHRDIKQEKPNPKNDVTKDLVNIIKSRVRAVKEESKNGKVKGKIKQESDEDSDYLPVASPNRKECESDEDFKPTKISPKPGSSRKIDRRIISTDEDLPADRIDVWCEVFVEELEEWVAVDVVRGKVHCVNEIYSKATHPVNYVIGWDNNNYLKDLTRRYVPQWNTVTRKQRVDAEWWNTAIKPWLGPKTARDKEEDERLDRMQLEAPLPKSIAEYKNHPLYALKRHLLKFEAIYPPDAAVLGFVRSEPVYARECVYVCRSRDTWVKEAKVVRLGEKPYKVVKARPKWDKLSNKVITDKPLEIFGPWQVQDYEPPTAENGIVPRNPYGNVELFKECMLPKGTVHIKLPGLNRVAKKLNIDCAPAMTGFDFNGGYTHPVYDGFVVCKEFEEIITEAWIKDQEEMERKEQEKMEARVYGNWKRLIKGLFIRERLKTKYGFSDPSTSQNKKKSKGPRFVVNKKN
ncbi:DNA repair protein complementing XP-C cells homolog [Zerene cesonia]|uniref:DNA repair protein complementing XP-C cells homolog n=1 Tax=Zerene cesonia TaxID=33412 RepID=UPI0018E59DC3|nr:DNA repair protein complementing XP-C cells homolog [Zerene cesonia]